MRSMIILSLVATFLAGCGSGPIIIGQATVIQTTGHGTATSGKPPGSATWEPTLTPPILPAPPTGEPPVPAKIINK
jgi:hypothetical protein